LKNNKEKKLQASYQRHIKMLIKKDLKWRKSWLNLS